GGTWIYDRAGWCPGMATDTREWDITPFVTPGQIHNIDYGMYVASGTSNYIVSNQLVSYGNANFNQDAALIEVLEPSNRIEYFRSNPMCSNPKVVIQNTGSIMLTNLTIEYWVNDATTHETFTWTGILGFLEKEIVELPLTSTLWSSVSGLHNKFHVEIKDPNSGVDEYSFNNIYTSDFTIPDVIPANFLVLFKTNNAAYESKWELFDDAGNQLFIRQGMANNTLYMDTFNLSLGCYSILISDTDDDGIDFWANNDGAGFARIMEVGGGIVAFFQADFGGSYLYNFTIDIPLTYEELNNESDIKLYPNPAKAQFFVEGRNIIDATIKIMNSMGQSINLPSNSTADRIIFNTSDVPKGVYFINIRHEERSESKTIVVE
ncbi:MAG: T9SS type A sorting domain-containing protein, partial [Bacteroidales bacterium]|nr:T9SS type A sorting domain-containing protein [Bacteroidales bacterium]